MSNVGFIGVGYMGYGMAKNLLDDYNVYVIAHKNRNFVEKLVKKGANEVKSYEQLFNSNLNCLMMCVSNTKIAMKIANEIKSLIKKKILIIDLTTHNKKGSIKISKIFKSDHIQYTNPFQLAVLG